MYEVREGKFDTHMDNVVAVADTFDEAMELALEIARENGDPEPDGKNGYRVYDEDTINGATWWSYWVMEAA